MTTVHDLLNMPTDTGEFYELAHGILLSSTAHISLKVVALRRLDDAIGGTGEPISAKEANDYIHTYLHVPTTEDQKMDDMFLHWSKKLLYTPGVRFVAEEAKAYWPIDAIASHQGATKLRREEFQVWRLVVAEDRSAVLWAEDGNDNKLVEQIIPYSDFPESEAVFYLVKTPGERDTLMLPVAHCATFRAGRVEIRPAQLL